MAVALGEALAPQFADYARQTIANAKTLADGLLERGFDLVSGGTDNHLILIDLTGKGVPGKPAAKALDRADHDELQHGPVRPAQAVRPVWDSHRNAGRDYARDGSGGDGADRHLDRRGCWAAGRDDEEPIERIRTRSGSWRPSSLPGVAVRGR